MTMLKRIVLIVIAIATMLMAEPISAAPDELEKYLESVAGDREEINVINADAYFEGRGLTSIEGVWRMSGSEGMMAIVADSGTIFQRIIVLESPDRNILPGTVMGVCTALGRNNSYDARIYTTESTSGILSKPKRFTLTLSDDGRLIMEPITNKLKVNLWRFLPYMFRMSVVKVNNRPDNLDGAVRVYPEAKDSPLTTRYL